MSGEALKGMQSALAPMRLYDLSEGSLISCELEAYQAGFDLVEEKLGALWRDAFVQTCGEAALARWEQLLRLPRRSGASLESRREIILYKLAVAPGDYTLEGMGRSVRAAGLEAEILEDPPLGALTLTGASSMGGFDSLDQLKRHVYAMLPAHLEAQFDVGSLTWLLFDLKDLTCQHLDSLDFTWQWFDLNGDQLT